LEKKIVVNNCLLQDKDNILNLLEIESVCKKYMNILVDQNKDIIGSKCAKIYFTNLVLIFQNRHLKNNRGSSSSYNIIVNNIYYYFFFQFF